MKYEVELPADVDRRLAERAVATGNDVEHLIETAVVQFVEKETRPTSIGQWGDDVQSRRAELIDKDIAGTIGAMERIELDRLDQLANEYFDRVAPPPMEGARQLHDHLLKSRAGRP
ncbi:MAG TPA: hypothetical protein VGX76_15575 [Pirellulales bacterium]|jgi:hypothetical protein|nr:hypothetical protein [Pirellulales bacterium]